MPKVADPDEQEYQDYKDYSDYQEYAKASQGAPASKPGFMTQMQDPKSWSGAMDKAQKAWHDPQAVSQGLGSMALNATTGGLGGKLAEYLKGKANNSMLRAVGLVGAKSKNLPEGVGNRMVDEGIWGTKTGMAEKVAKNYSKVEQEVQDLAEALPRADSGKLAQVVENKAQNFVNPETGAFRPGQEGASAFNSTAKAIREGGKGYNAGTPASSLDKYMVDNGEKTLLSSEAVPSTPASPGSYPGSELLKMKRAGDAEAFNQSGLVGDTWKAEAAKAQADAMRQEMATSSSGAMPKALEREQTLLYANKGLMQPSMVYKNPVSLTDIGSSMVGGATHGLPGAGTAMLASKAATTPLAQSLFAKGVQRASKMTPGAATAGTLGLGAAMTPKPKDKED